MNWLIGCEESGAIRDAMIEAGHNAWSCDLKPSRGKTLGQHFPDLYPPGHQLHYFQQHHQCDLFSLFYGRAAHSMALEGQRPKWDGLIAHPDCTYLTGSAAWAFKDGPYHQKVKPTTLVGAARRKARAEAFEFFMACWNLPVERICLENPVGFMSSMWREPDQTVQPYEYGDDASKRTCLWLKNLPLLVPTQYVPPRIVNGRPRWGNQTDSGQNRLSPSDERAANRSVTYPGIARAMAVQWGGLQPSAAAERKE